NLLLSLIYEYLLVEKKWDGPVVRNLSTTHLLDKIARKHGQYAVETPVGFKHITENMDKHKAIIGGESSGGLTISGHIKGKDGIFAAMLLVEMVAVTGKKIGQLVNELYREYGDLYNKEQAYSFDQDKKDSINNILFIEKKVPSFDNSIKSVSYLDGLKVYFDNDSWVSARFSGTEPLLRIFAESSSQDETEKIINNMEEFLEL
ncbi:MAG TPA: phosphoglucomutase/phosphomannomutase family protein, partial [Erysipelothrix sp.]|nr:phosphoglucomutase/phosphomannomutase family protein [Erysipelothrix sp.]